MRPPPPSHASADRRSNAAIDSPPSSCQLEPGTACTALPLHGIRTERFRRSACRPGRSPSRGSIASACSSVLGSQSELMTMTTTEERSLAETHFWLLLLQGGSCLAGVVGQSWQGVASLADAFEICRTFIRQSHEPAKLTFRILPRIPSLTSLSASPTSSRPQPSSN